MNSILIVNSIYYLVNEKRLREFSKLLDLLYTYTPGRVEIALPCSNDFVEHILNFNNEQEFRWDLQKLSLYKSIFQILQSDQGLQKLENYLNHNL